MKNLIIVRHGQRDITVSNGVHDGNNLSKFGKKQMKMMAKKIAEKLDDANCIIFSSDIEYAWDSANILSNELKCELLQYWRLSRPIDEKNASIIFEVIKNFESVILVTHREMTADLSSYLVNAIWGFEAFTVIYKDDSILHFFKYYQELNVGEAYVADYLQRLFYHLSALKEEKEK